MPLVRVDMIKGKSPEYKKTILDCIHVGLMESIGIEDWDRFQRIVEIPKEDFEAAPEKTDNFMIIELTMFFIFFKDIKKAVSNLEAAFDKLSWLLIMQQLYSFL